jgi:predicted RNA-binding Zn ribbon-like protein
MRPFIRTIETLELDGGILCLDFVNSVRNRFENPFYEFIITPDDWLLWSRRTQICDPSTEQKLDKYISENGDKAITELNRIIRVRETLYRIFRKTAQKEQPLIKDIRYFNKELTFSFRFLNLEINDSLETIPTWNYKKPDLIYLLLPILKSAYELLTSGLKDHIKECPNCGWLYLDKTRNKSRRWCNMKTCGNTEKTKKYYYKSRINVTDNLNK